MPGPTWKISSTHRGFWILLSGELRLQKRHPDGDLTLIGTISAGETFGEFPLLMGRDADAVITVLQPSTAVFLREELFWNLMFSCPRVRTEVLGNMARRLQLFQSQELHREKLISLGTMAAGLMHELNNPGAAAKSAASQMRENLSRLQQISLRMCGREVIKGQTECLRELQEQALTAQKPNAMSSMDQADAEGELESWLEDHGIENAWKLAPRCPELVLTPVPSNARSTSFPETPYPTR